MRSAQRETLPGLFDQGAPQPQPSPITPVGQEIERLNAAAERVLAYLERVGSATNVELSTKEIGGLGAIRRTWEINEKWKAAGDRRRIVKSHVSGGTYRYTLQRDAASISEARSAGREP